MAIFGDYQTVETIGSTGLVTVYAAIKTGGQGPPTHIVKAIRTSDDFASARAVELQVDSFRSRLERLKAMGAVSPQRFEQVVMQGITPATDGEAGTFYYVALLAPLSSQGMIDTRRDPTSGELLHLLRQLIEAVGSIRDQGLIAHGNLKPTNVLLSSRELGEARVTVTDPADPENFPQGAARADMLAIGAILFSLVAHREAPTGTQIRSGREWTGLGARGEALRKLCEELLNPTAGQDLDPKAVAARLEKIASLRERVKKGPIFAGLAAFVVIGACIAGYLLYKPSAPTLLVKDDEQLRAQVEAVQQAVKGIAPPTGSDASVGPLAAARETLNETITIVTEEGVTDETRPAAQAQLEALAADVGHLQAAIDTQKRLGELAAKFDETIRTQDTDLKKWIADIEKKARDMKDNPALAASREEGGIIATDMKGQTQKLAAAATRVRETVTRNSESLAGYKKRERKEDPLPSLASVKVEDLAPDDQTELDASESKFNLLKDRYAKWQRTSTEEGRKLEAALKAVKETINQRVGAARDDDASKAYLTRVFRALEPDRLDARLANTAQLDGVVNAVVNLVAAVRELDAVPKPSVALRGLDAAVSTLTVAWRTQETAAVYDSARIGDTLKSTLDKAPADAGALEKMFDASVSDAKARSAMLAKELPALSALFQTHNEMELALLNGFGFEEPHMPGRKLALDLASKPSIDGLAVLDKLATQSNERSVKEAAEPIRKQIDLLAARVTAVKEIGGKDRIKLEEVLNAETEKPGNRNLSLMLAAWDELIKVGYPANLGEWQSLSARITALVESAKAAPDENRRSLIEQRLKDSRKTAWKALVNDRIAGSDKEAIRALFSPEQLANAGLTAADLDKAGTLAPHAALNRSRLALEQALTAKGAAPAQNIKAEDAELGTLLTATFFPDVDKADAKLKEQLPGLDQKFAKARQGRGFLNLAEEGPGKLTDKWIASNILEDATSVTYTYTPKKGDAVVLQFGRIAIDDSTSTYLCTQEVSVGTFLAILESADALPAKGKGLGPVGALFPDPADLNQLMGPRAWTYFNQKDVSFKISSSRSALMWCANETDGRLQAVPYYIAAPPSPAPSSPMTYLNDNAAIVTAALVNCRLPTAAEFARMVGGLEPEDSNRRDAIWLAQFNHITTKVAALPGMNVAFDRFLPNHGIFRDDDNLGTKDSAAAVARNDGTLWFRAVDAGSQTQGGGANGLVYNHIFGNAAEFVTERPIPPTKELINNPKSASTAGGKTFVMGGSALSPPTVSPTADDLAVPVENKVGYSDVGFRLAFSTSGGGAGGIGNNVFQKAKATLDRFDFFSPPGTPPNAAKAPD